MSSPCRWDRCANPLRRRAEDSRPYPYRSAVGWSADGSSARSSDLVRGAGRPRPVRRFMGSLNETNFAPCDHEPLNLNPNRNLNPPSPERLRLRLRLRRRFMGSRHKRGLCIGTMNGQRWENVQRSTLNVQRWKLNVGRSAFCLQHSAFLQPQVAFSRLTQHDFASSYSPASSLESF